MSPAIGSAEARRSVARRAAMKVNWTWAKFRWQTRHCDHDWMVGDRARGSKACRHCGVWRWFPFEFRTLAE